MKKYLTKYAYLQFKCCPRLFAYCWFDLSQDACTNALNSVQGFLAAQGRSIGLLAQQLFSEQEAIKFEHTIMTGALLTRPDILDFKNRALIEIKSTTGVKEEHLIDVAFQKYVCNQAKYQINKFKIGYVNKSYMRDEKLEVNKLFEIKDVTEDVEVIAEEIELNISKIQTIVATKVIPGPVVGENCIKQNGCQYQRRCLGEKSNSTIFDLRRDVKGKKFELYQAGVTSLCDIPDYVQLTKYQQLQRAAEVKNCAVINQAAIAEALSDIVYPIYFLDFESSIQALPPYPNTSPYEQIPFQASIHKLKKKGHKLKHFQFLHLTDDDPRLALANFLIETLGEHGTIVVYHASFEKNRIYELIQIAPHYEQELLALIERIWDLEMIFDKGYYVHPDFRGSTGLKKVLPVLCPDLSYDHLAIDNGQLAFIQYLKMISADTGNDDKEKIRKDLIEYCKQDTFAMYAIFKKLSEIL